MSQWPIPSDREQLQFLKNIQRLLDEGSFVASYKFALLHALADLALLKGEDTGAPLELTTHQIATQFITLYWQQVRPFHGPRSNPGVVLKQNTGRQAGVINQIEAAHRRSAGSLYRLQQSGHKPILREVQEGACFYCNGSLSTTADVDHFIPWSRCHSDLAHNFVLVHRGCNAAKSDHLAFERHLETWVRRNRDLGVELDHRFEAVALLHDVSASISIARWAYSYVEGARGQVWIKADKFKHLDNTWREFLAS